MKHANLFVLTKLIFCMLISHGYAQEPVGRVSGDVSVSGGKLNYQLPITLPEGIHGQTPKMQVSYQQMAGISIMGSGFALQASSRISRCTAAKLTDGFRAGLELSSNTRFCNDGARMVAIKGLNGQANSEYRTVQDKNHRYFSRGGSSYTPDYWEKQTPEGYKIRYDRVGTLTDVQAYWLMTRVEDRFGNAMTYHYGQGDGAGNTAMPNPVLERIDYSGYQVKLNYEGRQDPVSQYSGGMKLVLDQRLASIAVFDGSQAMYEYQFAYEMVGNVKGSERLSSITQCYGSEGVEGCLRPVIYDYQELPNPRFIDDTDRDRTLIIPKSYYEDGVVHDEDVFRRPSPDVADVNNDGLVDFCFYKTGTGVVCALSGNSRGSGYYAPTTWLSDDKYEPKEEHFSYYNKLHLIDLDVDGYTDVCLLDDVGLRCGLNQQGKSFAAFSYWNEFTEQSQDPNRRIRSYQSNVLNRIIDLSLQFEVLKQDREITFNYINSDEYPDMCELRADDAYVCHAGNGAGFSERILELSQGIVDSRYIDSELLSVCQAYPEIASCRNKDKEILHKPFNMGSPRWVDIDGDLDQDLCWFSAKKPEMKCSFASANPSAPAAAPILSAPQVMLSFDYPLMQQVKQDLSPISGWSLTFNDIEESNLSSAYALVRNSLKKYANQNIEIKQFLSPLRFADLNADGLPDICYAEQSANYDLAYRCHLNIGSGDNNTFSAARTWLELDGDFFYHRLDAANAVYQDELKARKAEYQRITATFQLEDMNYDGLSDLCLMAGEVQKCAYNTIDGFSGVQDRQAVAADIEIDQQTFKVAANLVQKVFGKKTKYRFRQQRFGYGSVMSVPDINGDGFAEFCYRSIHGVLCTAKDNFASPNLLVAYTDSYGLTTSIEYASLIKGRLYSTSRANSAQAGLVAKPQESWVVKRITTDTGVVDDNFNANPIRNSERYRYGPFLVNAKQGVAGFQRIYTYEDGRSRFSIVELSMEKHLVGRKLRDLTYVNGKNSRSVSYIYSLQSRSHGRHAVLLDQTVTYDRDLDGSLVSREKTLHRNYDELGFASEVETSRRIIPTGENIYKVTRTDFEHNTNLWLLGRPRTQSVEHVDSSGSLTRSVAYEYQNGLLKKETIEPSSLNKLVMEFDYDAAGNIAQTKTSGLDNGVLRERIVKNTYDAKGRIKTETNALNQALRYEYDARCGGLQRKFDIADRMIAEIEYDALCRTWREYSLDANWVQYDYAWAQNHANLQNTPTNFPYPYRNPIVYQVKQSDAQGQETTTYYDANDQVVKTAQTGFSAGEIERDVVIYHQFDRYGRKTASSVPHYQLDFVPETSWVTVDYDEASRVKQETKRMADGNFLTTRYSYAGLSTTIEYDNYRKTTTNGVHNKPIQIDENGLLVTFRYKPTGDLASTTRGESVTTLEYDERGFKVKQIDPAMGTWQYDYNAFGDIVRQTDAKNQVIRYTYDNLGRVATRSDATQGVVSWQYHVNGNGLGQLKSEANADNSIVKTWAYDDLGRTAGELLRVDAQEFVTKYDYDQYSRLVSTTHPNQLRFANDYDNIGNVQRVTVPGDNIQGQDHLKDIYRETLRLKLQASQKLAEVKDTLQRYQAEIEAHDTEIKRLKDVDLYNANKHLSTMKYQRDQRQAFVNVLKLKVNELQADANATPNKSSYYYQRTSCSAGQCYWEFRRKSHVVRIPTSFSVSGGGRSYSVGARVDQLYTEQIPNDDGYVTGIRKLSNPRCRTIDYGDYEETICDRVNPRSAYTNAAAAFHSKQRAEELHLRAFTPLVDMAQRNVDAVKLKITAEERLLKDDQEASGKHKIQFNNEEILVINAESQLGGYVTQYNKELVTHRDNLKMLLGIDIPENVTLEELDALYTGAASSTASDGEKRFVVWATSMRNAHGQLQSEIFGNGLRTVREYSRYNGALQSIKTDSSISDTLRKVDYSYYPKCLISDKDDTEGQYRTAEHFDYDQRQQLTGWTFDGMADQAQSISLSRTYQYDDRGNMEQRATQANVGGNAFQTTDWMTYDPISNQLQSRRTSDGVSSSYSYDANGNMRSGAGRQYDWTAFNKASLISGGGKQVSFDYGASRGRLVKRSQGETIYYISPGYERVVRGSEIIHRHHIRNGDDVVATFEKREDNTTSLAQSEPDIAYYHRDSLGSGELVTDSRMQVIERRYYSPFGELVSDIVQNQLTADMQAQTHVLQATELQNYLDNLATYESALRDDPVLGCLVQASDTQMSELRGFTSHEEIKEFNLVNMNARLYDPVIARFINADSVIPSASMPLAYNRYAYVLNNPISYRDPTGHFPWLIATSGGLFIASQLSNNPNHHALGQMVLFAYMGHTGVLDVAGSPFLSGLAKGFAQTLIATGDVSASVESAVFSAVSAAVANQLAHGAEGGKPLFGLTENSAELAALHGFSQGVISELRGDKFGHGFMAGYMGKIGDLTGAKTTLGAAFSKMSLAYIGAEATGGDGIKAAIQASMVHLFNDLYPGARLVQSQHKARKANNSMLAADTSDGVDIASDALAAGKLVKLGYKVSKKSVDAYTAFMELLGVGVDKALGESMSVNKVVGADAGTLRDKGFDLHKQVFEDTRSIKNELNQQMVEYKESEVQIQKLKSSIDHLEFMMKGNHDDVRRSLERLREVNADNHKLR